MQDESFQAVYILYVVLATLIHAQCSAILSTHDGIAKVQDMEFQVAAWRNGTSQAVSATGTVSTLFLVIITAMLGGLTYVLLPAFIAGLTSICYARAWQQVWNRPVLEDQAPTTAIEAPLMLKWYKLLSVTSTLSMLTVASAVVGLLFFPEGKILL